jgi:hypothetical protein
MTLRIADWIQNAESKPRLADDPSRSSVVIPLRNAAVCGEDHVYDARRFGACPNCASEERIPLFAVLGHRPAATQTAS